MSARGLDSETFWKLFRDNRGKLYTTLFEMYPLMPPVYIMYFVDWCAGIQGNARVMTYVESDLGMADRSLALIDTLIGSGAIRLKGARCLDIGCSNGGLLLAAQTRGAGECVGVDICELRLISARKVGLGRRMKFLQLDASGNPLPEGFDVIFCLDVLEHASDWRRLVKHATQALAPGGTMFLSLHNGRHPQAVLSEPHYGVPGLVLLPPQEAAALWGRIRAGLNNTLDYDVTGWPSYREIRSEAVGFGVTAAPYVDCGPAYDPAFWAAPHVDLVTVEARAEAELARLGIADPDAAHLRAAVAAYGWNAVRDFHDVAGRKDQLRRFDCGVLRASEVSCFSVAQEARVDFYLMYHAQPLNILLRRP